MTRFDRIVRVYTTTGKARKYMACDWVAETEVEAYKAMMTEVIRKDGRIKPTTCINFDVIYFDDNGRCEMLAFVDNNFRRVIEDNGKIIF